MNRVRWTTHAEANLRDRAIERAEAADTLEAPDRRIAGRGGRTVMVRRYDDRILDQPMALCVVVEEQAGETVVVTVYKSSKLGKYLKGGAT
jgi:hypothetical protein